MELLSMTKKDFESFYHSINPKIVQKAKDWLKYLKASGQYSMYDLDDVVQETWINMMELPTEIGEEEMVEMAFNQTAIKLDLPRPRIGDDGGQIRVFEEPTEEVSNIVDARVSGFDNAICIEREMRKRLSDREFKLYNNFLKNNMELRPHEKRKRGYFFRHFTGWSQDEMANEFGITRQTLALVIKKIEKILKEVIFEQAE